MRKDDVGVKSEEMGKGQRKMIIVILNSYARTAFEMRSETLCRQKMWTRVEEVRMR